MGVWDDLQLVYNVIAMFRAIITILLSACFAAGLGAGLSCRKSVDMDNLGLSKQSAGSAPKAANVIKLADLPAVAAAPLAKQADIAQDATVPNRPNLFQHWAMLAGTLLVLFLLSVFVFHTMGRHLRKRSFKAHAPTRHANIWASHKPPQFLDP